MIKIFDIVIIFTACFISNINCRRNVKGISPSQLPFYRPAKEFRCLDGSQIIPYNRINDDYCDCGDGTDEPGTSACPNGSFFCANAGYKSAIIFSSRVNDGICDCCDGTDEYSGRIVCENNCVELGHQMREDELKNEELQRQGYQLYQEYCQQGKQTKIENQVRLIELDKESDDLDIKRLELEQIKKDAEAIEKEAKDRYQQIWDARKEEVRKTEAWEAFRTLDENSDNELTRTEFESHFFPNGDTSSDPSLTDVKNHFGSEEEIVYTDFLDKVWDKIKEAYQRINDIKPDEQTSDGKTDEGPSALYDETTKQLIANAESARNDYKSQDEKYREVEKQISEIKKMLDTDLGPNSEFYPIQGKCFDFTDREYIYSLCPFERASQRNKNEGGETSLGGLLIDGPHNNKECSNEAPRNWGKWTGPPDNKYSSMKYENGQNCWNGPNRSVDVVLKCGMINNIISVSEPNRCEYRYVFETPAVCSVLPPPPTTIPSTTTEGHHTHPDL